jgi:hypothetical protein
LRSPKNKRLFDFGLRAPVYTGGADRFAFRTTAPNPLVTFRSG